MSGSELVVRNLAKAYRGRRVVEDLSLDICAGEVVGLLGPNGAGKTTCFYMVLGLTRADAGSIQLGDQDLSSEPLHVRARAGIGYLPQEASVFRKLSVEDNLKTVIELRDDLDAHAGRELVESLLDEFNLQQVRKTLGERLSGGERRRVEIARALATEPRYVLLDEPFAGVDPISVAEIKNEIRRLAERNIGVLITDHNVRETLDICDRAYIVNAGTIIAHGSSEVILSNPTVRSVYLGEQFKL